MTMEPAPLLTLWGAKLAGAAAGSAISVAYLLPKSRREAATRFLIGLVTGVVFGAPAGLMLADRLALGDQPIHHRAVGHRQAPLGHRHRLDAAVSHTSYSATSRTAAAI